MKGHRCMIALKLLGIDDCGTVDTAQLRSAKAHKQILHDTKAVRKAGFADMQESMGCSTACE